MQQKRAVRKKAVPAKPVSTRRSNNYLFVLAAAVIVITFVALRPVVNNGFTNWDDNAYVFENEHLSRPLPEAMAYFFGPHYFVGNYVPLTMITFALEYHAAGLNPQYYHIVNLLLHLVNVLLVFVFIYLLSGKKPIVAALVSLFFGIHPMHVESVAWIAELKDVLFGCFFLAGLILYYRYTEQKKEDGSSSPKSALQLLLYTFILFALSVMSKPAAVTFPLVLLLLDFYTRRKFDRWVWIEKLPFIVVSVTFGIITIRSQQADKLLHDYYPFSQRIFFATHSLLSYLVRVFLPLNLSIFYPYPKLESGRLPYLYYVTPIIVAALCYLVYRTLKYTRLVVFGFLFFLLNIALVLQLLSVGDAIMADRYTYIPYIGLFFMMAMGFDSLYHNASKNAQRLKNAAIGFISVAALACAYLTYTRCQVWENDDTIATDFLEKFPEDRTALNNKGFILYEQGNYPGSVDLFSKAIRIKPDYTMAYINMINSYIAMKDMESAQKMTDSALKVAPHDPNLLTTKGFLLFTKNQLNEAIILLKEGIRLKPNNPNGYVYLSQSYYGLKDYDNSVRALDSALVYQPENYIFLNDKGYMLLLSGKYHEAEACFKASLKIKPGYPLASANLENCYRAMADSAKKKN